MILIRLISFGCLVGIFLKLMDIYGMKFLIFAVPEKNVFIILLTGLMQIIWGVVVGQPALFMPETALAPDGLIHKI